MSKYILQINAQPFKKVYRYCSRHTDRTLAEGIEHSDYDDRLLVLNQRNDLLKEILHLNKDVEQVVLGESGIPLTAFKIYWF